MLICLDFSLFDLGLLLFRLESLLILILWLLLTALIERVLHVRLFVLAGTFPWGRETGRCGRSRNLLRHSCSRLQEDILRESVRRHTAPSDSPLPWRRRLRISRRERPKRTLISLVVVRLLLHLLRALLLCDPGDQGAGRLPLSRATLHAIAVALVDHQLDHHLVANGVFV